MPPQTIDEVLIELTVRIRDTKEHVRLLEGFFERQEKTFRKQYPKLLNLKQDGIIFRQCTPGGGAEQIVGRERRLRYSQVPLLIER